MTAARFFHVQVFPLGGRSRPRRGMRGSHSSEWRLCSTKRGCPDGRLRVLPLIRQLRQDVFRFRSRNRRCSADEEKRRETHCVSYSSPPRGKPISQPPGLVGFGCRRHACRCSLISIRQIGKRGEQKRAPACGKRSFSVCAEGGSPIFRTWGRLRPHNAH